MQNNDDSDGFMPEPPLSRSEKVELFSEQYVQRQEWRAGEAELIGAVSDELRAVIDDRDDARLGKEVTTCSTDGCHEITVTVEIAGNAWVGPTDDSEGDG